MNKPYEFERPTPNPPHEPEAPSTTPWIDSGTIYVPIDMKIAGADVETGIYLPKGYNTTVGALNLVLYFHGNKDPKHGHVGKPIREIWKHAAYPLRQAMDAQTSYVLVAPTLANTGREAQGDFGSKSGAIRFIDELCSKLNDHGPSSNVSVSSLVLAAHSGGGFFLKKVLPYYEQEYGVDQVWAFDCLYDTTSPVCAAPPYRICDRANGDWPKIPHTHTANFDVNNWKSSIQGTIEHVLGSWALKGKPLRVYFNEGGSGTLIRTANLALWAKLNRLSAVTVSPDLYTGSGDDAEPVKPKLHTPAHDDIPKLKFPECLATL